MRTTIFACLFCSLVGCVGLLARPVAVPTIGVKKLVEAPQPVTTTPDQIRVLRGRSALPRGFFYYTDDKGAGGAPRYKLFAVPGYPTADRAHLVIAGMSVEDFTEFEQRAAYFDGDIDKAALKGVNPLDRASQVHHMAELQRILDFPPAPKLDIFGRLEHPASNAERRGEALFFGKARCASCHGGPHFSDNLMHDLELDRFFRPRVINGMLANGDGPIKTFPLRGIKESPPYLHDGRLLTLEDTIEFFNLVLQVDLTAAEKRDLLAYLLVL